MDPSDNLRARPTYRDTGRPVLFDDTSSINLDPGQSSYGMPQQQPPGQSTLTGMDPFIQQFATQYGSALAGQGRQYVNQSIDRWLPISRLRHYFCVDTPYVGRKLGILLFPFSHTDWSSQFAPEDDQAQIPRVEINAPDLYIPSMAVVTYFLTSGYILGMQHRFTPDLLGVLASSALAWLVLETLVVLAGVYLINLSGPLVTILDILAFCSYKFVSMVAGLLGYIALGVVGYGVICGWCCLANFFFLLRSLRVRFLAAAHQVSMKDTLEPSPRMRGQEHALYFLLVVAAVQPIMIYTHTRHLVFYSVDSTA